MAAAVADDVVAAVAAVETDDHVVDVCLSHCH